MPSRCITRQRPRRLLYLVLLALPLALLFTYVVQRVNDRMLARL